MRSSSLSDKMSVLRASIRLCFLWAHLFLAPLCRVSILNLEWSLCILREFSTEEEAEEAEEALDSADPLVGLPTTLPDPEPAGTSDVGMVTKAILFTISLGSVCSETILSPRADQKGGSGLGSENRKKILYYLF